MRSHVSLVRVLLGTAGAASLAACLAAGFVRSVPGVWFAAVSTAIVLGILVVDHRHGWWIGSRLLNEVDERAEAGRRRAMQERETGLWAHWYVTLRGHEECKRAVRYERPLTLLLVEPRPESNAAEIRKKLAGWFSERIRTSDVAGYLGDGRFALLMPETDRSGAEQVVGRLHGDVGDAETGLSEFPGDGTTYDGLYDVASRKLSEPLEHAA